MTWQYQSKDDAIFHLRAGEDFGRVVEVKEWDGQFQAVLVYGNFFNDKDVVLEAVKQNGFALQWASSDLRSDKEVVLAAVQNKCFALDYACDELKADKEIVIESVKSNRFAIHSASTGLQELCKDKDPIKALESALAHEKLQATLATKQEPRQELKRGLKI